jgi:hypothetical protein
MKLRSVFLLIVALSSAHVFATTSPATPMLPVLTVTDAKTGELMWHADFFIRNPTGDVIILKVGHLSFVHPPFDPEIRTITLTIQANETVRIAEVQQYYDVGTWERNPDGSPKRTVGAFWFVTFDPRLEVSGQYRFYKGGSFETDVLRSAMSAAGDTMRFYRVAVDATGNVGTFPVVMNTGASDVVIAFQLIGPDGSSTITTGTFVVPAGYVYEASLVADAPKGATLRICHTVCGVGTLTNDRSPVYAFTGTGTFDGGTLGTRYAQ